MLWVVSFVSNHIVTCVLAFHSYWREKVNRTIYLLKSCLNNNKMRTTLLDEKRISFKYLRKQYVLTCFNSLGFTASFLALSSHVPRRKLSSEASNKSISFISWRNLWLFNCKASIFFVWNDVTALMYIWFANFDNTCRVKSTRSYLSKR